MRIMLIATVCFSTFSKLDMESFSIMIILRFGMNTGKEEMLKGMPKWFLKLREIYWKKYNKDLYDLLDDLAQMAND